MYHIGSGRPVDVLPKSELFHSPNEAAQKTKQAELTAPDPCANVTCQPSTLVCPDGFEAICGNTCNNQTGKCTNCTPDCTGHQDLCANITCRMSFMECPDGFLAACQNTCNPETGLCTNCTPDCTDHQGCQPDWECTGWSRCIDGEQTRNCTDKNECGTDKNRPPETQDCETPEVDHVVFSEVYYDTSGKESEEEWLELYNPTPLDVNLSGWKIADNTKNWSIPNDIVITAHSYLTISRNSTAFYTLYSCSPDLENLTLSLSNSGDYLMLWNRSVLVDFVAWESGGSGNPYPEWDLSSPEGRSIKRIPPNQDMDVPDDWLENQQPEPAC